MPSVPVVYNLAQIKRAIRDPTDIIDAMAECFKAYSRKTAYVAPVVHLGDPSPALTGGGSVCVKTGYMLGADRYVVKVAGGGFKNASNSGAMLVFCQKTGHMLAVLADEGELTEMRTAAAGALSVREMGPQNVQCIGVIGSGVQARFQLDFISRVCPCRKLIAYGRTPANLEKFAKEMRGKGWNVATTQDPGEVARQSQIIVTVTMSTKPLVKLEDVQPGTHIVCIGADSHGKQEIDERIVAKADLVVVDSIAQCVDIGEVQHAIQRGLLGKGKLVEMGKLLDSKQRARRGARDITVFDSTGVAVQDVAITNMVYGAIQNVAKL